MTRQPTRSELIDNLARSEAREADSRRVALETKAWLTATIENSSDAILTLSLDGIVMSWNGAAEKLFAYTAVEAIGEPITIIIPKERLDEERMLIARLGAGKQVDRFDTVWRRKDGTPVEIALTGSPVRDESGNVLGAFTIVGTIVAANQDLLLREVNHRIKNLFAVATSLVALSARAASDVDELADDLTGRMRSLSRAHALLFPGFHEMGTLEATASLPALISEIVSPYDDAAGSRIAVAGEPVPIGHHAVPTLGLLFHELATNAAKHGGLASPEGRLNVKVAIVDDVARIRWEETGCPKREHNTPVSQGFGSRLAQTSVATLRGQLERTWRDDGVEIVILFPCEQIGR